MRKTPPDASSVTVSRRSSSFVWYTTTPSTSLGVIRACVGSGILGRFSSYPVSVIAERTNPARPGSRNNKEKKPRSFERLRVMFLHSSLLRAASLNSSAEHRCAERSSHRQSAGVRCASPANFWCSIALKPGCSGEVFWSIRRPARSACAFPWSPAVERNMPPVSTQVNPASYLRCVLPGKSGSDSRRRRCEEPGRPRLDIPLVSAVTSATGQSAYT